MATPLYIADLPPLRLASRAKQEYAGACPFCGGDHTSDRFRVWPQEGRYWCRQCNVTGWLDALSGERPRTIIPPQPKQARGRLAPQANPAHVAHYRELYAAVALWAHSKLYQDHNPEPLAYLRQRGLDAASIGAALLGYTLSDPAALPSYLRREHPALLAYGEAAGVLVREQGALLAHFNLRGAILLPYMAEGQITDLRTRSFPGKGYKSLPGGYADRGATAPFGWDSIGGAETVIITEGEIKALAVNQAYRNGQLSAPALAHPGLSYWRSEWAAQLHDLGVRTVILAYDSQPRPLKDGAQQLAPEEIYSIRHGQRLAEAGLTVRVLRLPLVAEASKADLDAFLLDQQPAALERLLSAAPSLADYHASLPRQLLRAAKLPESGSYPRHRARPRRTSAPSTAPAQPRPTDLATARAAIPALVQQHAEAGQGMLVLAHPPGAGKGQGTTTGLRAYLQIAATPGQLVWTALRKEQIHDQQGLDLIPLQGRSASNCHKHSEAQVLARKGYPVLASLCQRRCPYVDHCAYLRQFSVEADRFAPQPLLQAINWWQNAGVIVLDEFDPAQLTKIVMLTSRDLAAMRAGAGEIAAQTILSWLSALLGDSGGRALRGLTLLNELDAIAARAGQDLDSTLQSAIAALPPTEDQAMLKGLRIGATLADYQALPPGHLPTLLHQLAREARLRLAGQLFTSRLELRDGELILLLRHEHLIAQLANPAQPKILLDATITPGLVAAIFPHTPLQIVQPHIPVPCTVRQLLRSDWAKSTLRGARREEWYDAVAEQIRPDRPTLVVCTQECETDLRAALAVRGHDQVAVSHFGGLRGSNQYTGHDVIVAQVYHPNHEGVLREGRALFADDGTALDEQMILVERTLQAADGEFWAVQVPTFADPRLAALLERRREAEMVQCALRGRPFDHPDVQITLMCSMPLPGLPPTTIIAPAPSPASGGGRRQTTLQKVIAGGRQLLSDGHTHMSVDQLARAAEVSVVTVRANWQALAAALGLEAATETFSRPGSRDYQRAILRVPSPQTTAAVCATSTDQANNKDLIINLICAHAAPECAELTCETVEARSPLYENDGSPVADSEGISLRSDSNNHHTPAAFSTPELVISASEHDLVPPRTCPASQPPLAAHVDDDGSSRGAQQSPAPTIGLQLSGADGGGLSGLRQGCRLQIGRVGAQRARLQPPTDRRVVQKCVEGVEEVNVYSLCQEILRFRQNTGNRGGRQSEERAFYLPRNARFLANRVCNQRKIPQAAGEQYKAPAPQCGTGARSNCSVRGPTVPAVDRQ
jgi:hypothetical protein